MKRILIVGDFLTGSGLTRFIFNVFNKLSKEEYDVTAVGYGAEANSVIENRCKKLGWNFQRITPVTQSPIKHLREWIKLLKTYHFDIIYFNYSSSWNFLPVRFAKKYQKAQIICHSHNSYYSHTFKNSILMCGLDRLNNFGKKYFNKNVDIKIATSKEAASWMFGTTKNVNVIKNGIDLEKFVFNYNERQALRKRHHVESNDCLVGFVGVLQNRKNPLFAVEVFNRFHKKIPNSKLIMIGKGELRDTILKKVEKLGLTDKVILLSYAPNVNNWYSAMDILIFPSLYEGFGLVPLEAQVSNLPVLVSKKIPDQVIVNSTAKKINSFNANKWGREMLLLRKLNNIREAPINKQLLEYSSEKQFKIIESLFV